MRRCSRNSPCVEADGLGESDANRASIFVYGIISSSRLPRVQRGRKWSGGIVMKRFLKAVGTLDWLGKIALFIGLPLVLFAGIAPVVRGDWSWWVSVLIVAFVVLASIIEAAPTFFSGNESFFGLFAMIAAFYALDGDDEVAPEFFAVAAQVIPVLFLALAIEGAVLSVRNKDEAQRRGSLLLAFGLAWGEFQALRAVAGATSDSTLASVGAPMVGAAVALLLLALTSFGVSAED